MLASQASNFLDSWPCNPHTGGWGQATRIKRWSWKEAEIEQHMDIICTSICTIMLWGKCIDRTNCGPTHMQTMLPEWDTPRLNSLCRCSDNRQPTISNWIGNAIILLTWPFHWLHTLLPPTWVIWVFSHGMDGYKIHTLSWTCVAANPHIHQFTSTHTKHYVPVHCKFVKGGFKSMQTSGFACPCKDKEEESWLHCLHIHNSIAKREICQPGSFACLQPVEESVVRRNVSGTCSNIWHMDSICTTKWQHNCNINGHHMHNPATMDSMFTTLENKVGLAYVFFKGSNVGRTGGKRHRTRNHAKTVICMRMPCQAFSCDKEGLVPKEDEEEPIHLFSFSRVHTGNTSLQGSCHHSKFCPSVLEKGKRRHLSLNFGGGVRKRQRNPIDTLWYSAKLTE